MPSARRHPHSTPTLTLTLAFTLPLPPPPPTFTPTFTPTPTPTQAATSESRLLTEAELPEWIRDAEALLNARKAAELGPKVEVDMAPRERKSAGYKVRVRVRAHA